ncbi:hypothetical protein HNY73_010963 [Argiope bruennichi]|uniref:MBD domain-containing protein n=1 Tax=Argiope bruennichi TaxID=94029 RepID=A0A8T0F540_ARGBR|nr:hypothetical protein HNY73_010963 [Argiope bruennichi]
MESNKKDVSSKWISQTDLKEVQKHDLSKQQSSVTFSGISRENEQRGAIPKSIQKTDLPKGEPNISASFPKMNFSNENLPASPIRISKTDSEPVQKSDLNEIQPNMNMLNENLLASPIRVPKTDSEAIQKSDLTEVQPNAVAASSKKSEHSNERKFAQGSGQEVTCQSSEPSTSSLAAEQMGEKGKQESEEYITKKWLESDKQSWDSLPAEEMEETGKLESEEYIEKKWPESDKQFWESIDNCANDYEFPIEDPSGYEGLGFIDKAVNEYEFPIEDASGYEALGFIDKGANDYEFPIEDPSEYEGLGFLGKGSSDIEFPIEPPPEYEGLEVLGVKLDRLEAWAEDHFKSSQRNLKKGQLTGKKYDFQLRKDRCYTLIYTNNSADLKSLITETTDGVVTWNILKNHFQPVTRARVIQLLDEFFGTIYRPGEDIGIFISRVKTAATRLQEAGHKLDDLYIGFQLIRWLPQEFQSTVQQSYRWKEEDFRVVKIEAELILEANRLTLMKQDLEKAEDVYFSSSTSKKKSWKVPRKTTTVPSGAATTPEDPSGKVKYQKKDEENKLVETINVRFDENKKGIDFKSKANNYSKLNLNLPDYDDEDDFDTIRDSLTSRLVSKISTKTPSTSHENPDLSSDNRNLIPCSEVKWIRNIDRKVTGSNVYYNIKGTATRLRSFDQIEQYCKKHNIEYNPNLFDFSKEDSESQEFSDLTEGQLEANVVEVYIPNCYKQAIESRDASKWYNAMDKEINIMKERKVWDLVDPPDNAKILGNRWVIP